MKTSSKITLGLLALLGAGAVVADAAASDRRGPEGGRHGGAALLRMLDQNGDGAVTTDEAEAARADWLARFDADGDGALALEEYAALHAELTRSRMVDRFQRLDEDGDGRVTEAEMAQPFERMARRMDFDGDGDVDEDDVSAMRERRGGWRRDRGED